MSATEYCRNAVTVRGRESEVGDVVAEVAAALHHRVHALSLEAGETVATLSYTNRGSAPAVEALAAAASAHPTVAIMDEWALFPREVDGMVGWEGGRIVVDIDWDRDERGQVRDGTVRVGIGLVAEGSQAEVA